MKSPVCGAPCGWIGVPNARAEGPADLRRRPTSRMAGAKAVLSERWFGSGALYAEARSGALSSKHEGRSSRALGPLGRPRRCRWRPGRRRLYPNVSYRASAHPAPRLRGQSRGFMSRSSRARMSASTSASSDRSASRPCTRRRGGGRAPRASRSRRSSPRHQGR